MESVLGPVGAGAFHPGDVDVGVAMEATAVRRPNLAHDVELALQGNKLAVAVEERQRHRELQIGLETLGSALATGMARAAVRAAPTVRMRTARMHSPLLGNGRYEAPATSLPTSLGG